MIAVTGAGGFIGSHLVEVLRDVRAGTHYSHGNFGEWAGDITDPVYCDRLIEGCEACYHLAALIEIPYSYRAVKPFLDTNIIGTYNILEACKRHRCKLIHVSSSEVYGSALHTPMDEEHPLKPSSPYAVSKLAAEQLVQAYWQSYDMDSVIVRPFNTYGPRQSDRAFIPHVIKSLLKGNKVQVGDLSTKRDLTYVSDTVAGIIAARKGCKDIYNLGTGRMYGMHEIVEVIAELLGRDVGIEVCDSRLRPQDSEVRELCSCNDWAQAMLRWEPQVSLKDGLEKTIESYQQD